MTLSDVVSRTEYSYELPTDGHRQLPANESPPLKILIVTPRYHPDTGGIETHVHEVSRRLAGAGNDITILTTDRSGKLPKVQQISGVTIRRVRARPRNMDYYFAPAIYREVATAECDIVHIQGYHTFVPPIAMLAAIRRGIPFFITFHSGGHSSWLRTAMRRVQWSALSPLVRRATGWIGVSKFEAELFSKHMRLPRDRVAVVRNGSEVAPAAVLPDTSPHHTIVSIGRLERYKGHHRVIEAFSLIIRRFPDARLRILGDGPYRAQLDALIRRKGLEDAVEVGGIPSANRAELSTVLGNASLVTLLSDYEAHPVSVMEALALGRSVLVTNCTGFIELIDEGFVSGIPSDATSEEIADAMIMHLCKPREVPPLQLPSWSGCVRRLLELYHAALQTR